MNENPEVQKTAKEAVVDALEQAELDGATSAELKRLKAMMSVGQQRVTKKYPTPAQRLKKQRTQKASRKANRK